MENKIYMYFLAVSSQLSNMDEHSGLVKRTTFPKCKKHCSSISKPWQFTCYTVSCPKAAHFGNVNDDVVSLNMTDGYSEDNTVTQKSVLCLDFT